MKHLDAEVLAERTARIERHLRRVADRLPAEASDLAPATDASDAVVLHLWQATQAVLDLAASACVRLGLGSPTTYADAFVRLASAGYLPDDLARRLVLASGFRNLVAHAYDDLDMVRLHAAATRGPADLRAFLAAMARLARG